jgi:hypothetical protein
MRQFIFDLFCRRLTPPDIILKELIQRDVFSTKFVLFLADAATLF